MNFFNKKLFLLLSFFPIVSYIISQKNNSDNSYDDLLINNIVAKAKNGLLINCDLPLKTNQFDIVISIFGEPDKEDPIFGTNGFYYTYKSRNLMLGLNKDGLLFEARCFDPSISILNPNKIIQVLGKPDHDVILSEFNQRELGYIINEDFHLEFIIDESLSNKKLDHYNILSPLDTKNFMAGYAGRDW